MVSKMNEKDDLIVLLIVALNALSNEALALVKDRGISAHDGRHLKAAADHAHLTVQVAARHVYGEYVQ